MLVRAARCLASVDDRGSRGSQRCLEHVAQNAENAMEALVVYRPLQSSTGCESSSRHEDQRSMINGDASRESSQTLKMLIV